MRSENAESANESVGERTGRKCRRAEQTTNVSNGVGERTVNERGEGRASNEIVLRTRDKEKKKTMVKVMSKVSDKEQDWMERDISIGTAEVNEKSRQYMMVIEDIIEVKSKKEKNVILSKGFDVEKSGKDEQKKERKEGEEKKSKQKIIKPRNVTNNGDDRQQNQPQKYFQDIEIRLHDNDQKRKVKLKNNEYHENTERKSNNHANSEYRATNRRSNRDNFLQNKTTGNRDTFWKSKTTSGNSEKYLQKHYKNQDRHRDTFWKNTTTSGNGDDAKEKDLRKDYKNQEQRNQEKLAFLEESIMEIKRYVMSTTRR